MNKKRIFYNEKTNSRLIEIYGEKEANKKNREVMKYKKTIAVVMMFFTTIFSLVVYYYETYNASQNITYLERGEPGEGDRVEELAINYLDNKTDTIKIPVKEKQYTQEELNDFAKNIEKELSQTIINNNTSFEEINSDLNLVTNLENYPFDITWKSDHPMLINNKGVIDKKRIKEEMEKTLQESIIAQLCANIKYYDFSMDIYYNVALVIKDGEQYETFSQNVLEDIEKVNSQNKTSDIQVLPEIVGGIDVSYSKAKRNNFLVIVVLGIVITVLLIIGKDKEIEKEADKRKVQMDKDYPKILSQYQLYYRAGMSHRAIWEEICRRYSEEKKETGVNRVAFEEMIITGKQVRDGVSWIDAYEDFAKRCNNMNYRTFVGIIEQSLKNGAQGTERILEDEVLRSRSLSNNRVRMEIQELSTKLLFPMIIMLIVVIVIVIVPAFISFR